ncbi:hypothetical protein DDD_2465 [Nonlabens dokdonensis DSW-6]|uniref:Uncharacterized protein n=1 Tax=Nonlabens dokdonensis (strain DSM 17205 / KCTC 12402 / DSW-6) TaxID=592029 RepID=L7WBK0_NONDD|nr:hypothetical protein DDD_2465 [Nonlabens dokdonensis DSW-6]
MIFIVDTCSAFAKAELIPIITIYLLVHINDSHSCKLY